MKVIRKRLWLWKQQNNENNEREILVIGKFPLIAKTKIHLSFSFVELENSSNSISIFLCLVDCSGVCEYGF